MALVNTVYLLENATGTATGGSKNPVYKGSISLQAKGQTTSGAGAADVVVEVSNDNSNWVAMGTISLTLSDTTTSDGFVSDARWPYIRGRVDSISGTGAAVSLLLGGV